MQHLGDQVTALPRQTAVRSGWTALAISFATHALGAGAIAGWGAGTHGAAAEVAEPIAVDLLEPQIAAPATAGAPAVAHQHARPRATPPRRASPAIAVATIDRAAAASAPVDFTGLTFAGPASSGGASARPADGAAGFGGVAAGGTASGRARPVGLDESDWRCPWPDQAEAMDKNREDVVIRVVVGADGVTQSARLVRDPGHGFGAAALACARQSRFVPARDAAGAAIAAESPPIRVRFTR
jgi:protein TonB